MSKHTAENLGNALRELGDVMICSSNDFHLMHFNIRGEDFDTMHRKVLKKYYEEAAEDYDEANEKAGMYGIFALNACGAAGRVEYKPCEGSFQRGAAVQRCEEVLENVCSAFVQLYSAFNDVDDCPIAIGTANWLQTRIEYWSKELHYFNMARIAG